MPNPCAAIIGVEGLSLGRDEAAFLRAADPLGLILFGRNVESPDQIRRLTGDLRTALGRDAPILIDQEGGRVQRLRAPHWREWLPPLDQMARARPDVALRSIWIRYRMIAAELHAVGIDVNCVPSCDIASDATHPFLMNRCFGRDADTVAGAARAAARGLLAGGVLPVMKHIPGHGRTLVDSHHHLPTALAPADELDVTDFAPFRALNDLPIGMTAHIVVPAHDPLNPATQSAAMVRVIREQIGFEGLLLTDDLGMQALTGGPGERAARALAAGCDVALHGNGNRAELTETIAACGPLTAAAQARATTALACRQPPDPIDEAALMAELASLVT